ncbi:MAG: deoxyribose-phosphate aldolase [Candidatus Eremiobacteraeota bacterium]|uniref:deoxyribose-phosphate aldolase n=1 Tax=mine drainage metagenome TaxID=410659 RepID=E6PDS4_9ZZZZ|nr:deoxyribose-phosphate aldolase [Candidatus Eremiobacteraeota bacterium]
MKQLCVDAVMLESRASELAARSIKGETKSAWIDLAISCIDLTTLEGRDTPGRVRSLCAKARTPLPGSDAPSVAAVCVYPNFVGIARRALEGSSLRVASVATAFPAGQAELSVKLADTEQALEAGADEIDMVIDRGAFLSGAEDRVVDEITIIKKRCGDRHLKVILETGELGSYTAIRRACDLALEAGADTIKSSTGKIGTNATFPTALAMCDALAAFSRRTGVRRGLKLAGGIRTTKQALGYLAILNETLGTTWLAPERFRLGASALLDDLLMQRERLRTGHYTRPERIPKD